MIFYGVEHLGFEMNVKKRCMYCTIAGSLLRARLQPASNNSEELSIGLPIFGTLRRRLFPIIPLCPFWVCVLGLFMRRGALFFAKQVSSFGSCPC